MALIIKRVKLVAGQLLNILTDLIVPVIELVELLATILPVPQKVITVLKRFEEFLKNAGTSLEELL